VQVIFDIRLSDDMMNKLGLDELQRKVVVYIKENKRINNNTYQKLFAVSKPTASRHLQALEKKGVLRKVGTTGPGTYYVLKGMGS